MPILNISDNGYWAVNGTPIYTPTDVTIEHENIVAPESGRVESGYNRIVWVRRDVHKVNLTFKYLTGAEAAFLKNLMQGQEFTFTYYDNGIQSLYGYCGKCNVTQKNLSVYADEGGLCADFKANVIEM